MNGVVIVPFRPTDERRQRNWEYAERWWRELGFPICEGDGPSSEPFDITAARNAAVEGAIQTHPEWEIAFMVDADVVLGAHQQALYAAELAMYGSRYVVCHSEIRYLSEAGSDWVLEGGPIDRGGFEDIHSETWESAFVFSREVWVGIGGFDPRFRGFGHQVEGFFRAAQTLFGASRQTGRCYHLWHTYSANLKNPYLEDNAALVERYRQASGNRELMLALLCEYDSEVAKT